MATTTTTTCSDCMLDVVLDVVAGEARVQIPSNGKRGSLHKPAHWSKRVMFNDGDLLTWDCPACGYADSYDLHQEG